MRLNLTGSLAILIVWPCLALAGPTDPLRIPDPRPASDKAPLTDAQKYCQNIAAAAADARFAWQSKKIAELETQLQQRVADLEAKQAEYRAVLQQREDAMTRAKAALVGIYAHMQPEPAASQLSALDDATAAAVLSQLNPRQASAILDEIAPDRAVRLVNTITSLVPPADGKSAPAIDGKKS